MTRLSLATLAQGAPGVARPAYDPAKVGIGVAHFGPGAFHRAHQAEIFDRMLAHDPRWGIAAVSLRSGTTTQALAAQDGLYTLAVIDRNPAMRVIGAHRDWIGPGEEARLEALLCSPALMIVSSTITEKGYCLGADGTLDLGHADIVHDLGAPRAPRSFVGWLVHGLGLRRAANLPPFAVLCCDNLTGNGAKLRAATLALAQRRDPALADWIAARVAFPDSMVDSITPASDGELYARVEAALGLEDRAAVQREAFTQWVLQDVPLPGDPDFAAAGVIRTADVRAYEQAKLRILNGAHSSIAYLGLALGHETVAEAMADDRLAHFAERLIRQNIIPSLGAVPGLDLIAYAEAILERFRNPAIRHLLAQIAWDGSQKLPYRLLGMVSEALDRGRPIDRLAVPVAAWMAFVQRMALTGQPIVDPMAERLSAIGRAEREAAGLAQALLAEPAIFDDARLREGAFRDAVVAALATMIAGETGRLVGETLSATR